MRALDAAFKSWGQAAFAKRFSYSIAAARGATGSAWCEVGEVHAGAGRQVGLVDADVEAGLLELLFDVDLAILNQRRQVGAHPCDLWQGKAALGDVHGLAGEVRGGGYRRRRGRRLPLVSRQALLELDRADGGVDLERGVEAGVVVAGHIREEARGPDAGVAAIVREALVDADGVILGEGDELELAAHGDEVSVVLDVRSRPSWSAIWFWWRRISREPLRAAGMMRWPRLSYSEGSRTGVEASSCTLFHSGNSEPRLRLLIVSAAEPSMGLSVAGWGAGSSSSKSGGCEVPVS